MDIITFLISILVSFLIGATANIVSPIKMPGSWAGAIFAGFVGAWLGQALFGSWGPALVGFSLIPALIGAVLIIIIVGFIAKKR